MNVVSEGRFHRVIDVRTDAGGIHRGIECKRCHQVSFNPNDVERGYCGACHVHLADREASADALKTATGFETHLTRPLVCTRCKVAMELATATAADHPHPPSEGDAMVCAECGHLNVFDAGGQLREPTDDDWRRFSPHTREMIRQGQQHFSAYGAARRRWN